ncbi:MAG: ATPase [Clostridiales bacterium]|nr:ATPase [Clostridiales bacterium]
MSVEKVSFITVSGPRQRLDDAAKICAESGIFHSENAQHFYSEIRNAEQINPQNSLIEQYEKFAEFCDMHNISFDCVQGNDNETEDLEYLNEFVDKYIGDLSLLYEKKRATEESISAFKDNFEVVEGFCKADIDFDRLSKCSFIKTGFGMLPDESTKLINGDNSAEYIFIPIFEKDDYCCGMFAAPQEFSDEAERSLAKLGFIHIDSSIITQYKFDPDRLSQLVKELESINSDINAYLDNNNAAAAKCLLTLYALCEIEKVKANCIIHKDNFILTGWVTKKDQKALTSRINEAGLNCKTTSGKDELKNNPPIKLKNSFFAKPFEFYVDMFGLPAYNEIDPTAFVAITYTLLFGIMFGDVGQGICLSTVGFLMWKLKRMKLGKLLIPCGISSAIFGFVYGSVFGFEHALDGLYKSMGFKGKPIEVMESQTINMIIYAAVGIGVTLVVVAMLLNIYASIKKRDIGSALFSPNGLAGVVFYSALVYGLLGTLFLGADVFTPSYIICLIVVPIIAMYLQEPLINLVNGKKHPFPEKWGEYLLQSFFELFETMLGYISNTMSFLRVGAFVLVHAGMMMVVAILAGDTLSVSFVIIEIIGNIIVMALEGLLVGIQVLRLEFYEMFSRFYTGSGRPFKAIQTNMINKNK